VATRVCCVAFVIYRRNQCDLLSNNVHNVQHPLYLYIRETNLYAYFALCGIGFLDIRSEYICYSDKYMYIFSITIMCL
jgi:hypothetical protein